MREREREGGKRERERRMVIQCKTHTAEDGHVTSMPTQSSL